MHQVMVMHACCIYAEDRITVSHKVWIFFQKSDVRLAY